MKNKISQRIGLLSVILSFISTLFFAFIIMPFVYDQMPQYKEFVTGYTSWTTYYKSGDLVVVYFLIGGILFFYGLFLLLFSFLSQKIVWLTKNIDIKHTYESEWINKWTIVKKSFFIFLFMQFSIASLLKLIDLMIPGNISVFKNYFFYIQVICLITAIFFLYDYIKYKNEIILNQVLLISQLLLPLCFYGISQYEYIWNGTVITQYDSIKLKFVMGSLTIILIGYNFYCIFKRDWKKKNAQIYVTSFLSLSVFASYVLPKGTISGTPLEMFHYGEISVPFHQMLNFGKIPYFDIIPIHGICDYFQAGIWYTLFDGTYAQFEPAMVIGCVFISVITSAIIYYYVKNKWIGLLCILLFSLFGDLYYYIRWAFAFPYVLILFSEKVRTDYVKFLWYWTFLSILSIAWNPSIGGALALAVFPIILYEGFYEKGWRAFLKLKKKKDRKEILSWYLPLFILGVCFIPIFFSILGYIRANSEAMLETIGDILLEELTTAYVWYAVFGFVFSILAVLYFLIGKKGKEKKLAIYTLIYLILFNLIIAQYTFVKTQMGERGIIVTCFCSLFVILMVFIPYLEKHRSTSITVTTMILFVFAAYFKGADLLELPKNIFMQDEIPSDYLYASVEETKIPGLGNIFITESQKEELMSLNELTENLRGGISLLI